MRTPTGFKILGSAHHPLFINCYYQLGDTTAIKKETLNAYDSSMMRNCDFTRAVLWKPIEFAAKEIFT